MRLDFDREGSIGDLVLPLLNPTVWANVMENLFEVLAWFVVVATQFFASIEVDERLGAVASLIGVWVPWVEWSTEWQLLDLFRSWFRHLQMIPLFLKKQQINMINMVFSFKPICGNKVISIDRNFVSDI